MRFSNLVLFVVAALLASVPAGAASSDEEMALRHYEKAQQLFEERQYAHAIAEFDAARRLRPDPALDFNIALCHDVLGDRSEALAAYRRYLGSTPPPADATQIRARIRQLEEKRPLSPAEILMRRPAPPQGVAESPRPAASSGTAPLPTPAAAAASVSTEAATPTYKKWWVWMMVVEGVVALAAIGFTLDLLLAPVDAPVPSTTLGSTALGFR